MVTKLISTLSFILSIAIACKSQNAPISLRDIKIDEIELNEARYELKDFGNITNQKKWKEEYEDFSRQFTEIQYDSIEVLYYTNSKGMKFIYWIKIVGGNHIVKYKENSYHINNSAEILSDSFPDIYSDYQDYIMKNQNNQDTVYFGRPITIINKYNRSESYEGSFKFGIFKNKIKEILIDLRSEGDYD